MTELVSVRRGLIHESRKPVALPLTARAAIHQAVHNVVLQFGFQVFNRNPSNKKDAFKQEWTQATEAVVSHRLEEELEHKYLRSSEVKGSTRFEASVLKLSKTIFTPYTKWKEHVRLDLVDRAGRGIAAQQQEDADKSTAYFLYELALYYLIYSEAANLRHLPELLWFIFWICRHSTRFKDVHGLHPDQVCSPQYMVNMDWTTVSWWPMLGSSLPDVRYNLRNMYQATIARLKAQIAGDERVKGMISQMGGGELGTSSYYITVGKNIEVVRALKQYIDAGVSKLGAGTGEDVQRLLEWLQKDDSLLLTTIFGELVLYGDGGMFLEKVVQPVFVYLTEQVQLMGGAKEEASLRVGYDDCNESLCVPAIVHYALFKLGVLPRDSLSARGVLRIQHDPWEALLTIGNVAPPRSPLYPSAYRNYPRDPRFLDAEPQILLALRDNYENYFVNLEREVSRKREKLQEDYDKAMRGLSPEKQRVVTEKFNVAKQQLAVEYDCARLQPVEDHRGKWEYACVAANWWADHVFTKTFMERRSFWMIFRAFFRVYAFHLVLFHILCAFAWASSWDNRWYYACTAVFTHAVLHIMDNIAGVVLFSPLAVVRKEEQPLASINDEENRRERVPPISWRVGAGLQDSNRHRLGLLAALLAWVCILVALIVFFASSFKTSWVPNFLQSAAEAINLDGDQSYVIATAIYAAIWVVYELFRNVRCGFALRHVTEYFGLPAVERYFHRRNMSTPFLRFWSNVLMWVAIFAIKIPFDYFAVLRPLKTPLAKLNDAGWAIFTAKGWTMDILLVIAQVVPNFLVCLFDTGIFYQLVAAVVGTGYGLMKLRLGQVRNWRHVIAAFVEAPGHWRKKCVSADGFFLVVQTLTNNRFSNVGNKGRRDGMPQTAMTFQNPYDQPGEIEELATWVCFLLTWNDIVRSLRTMDLVSNKERGYLMFEEVHSVDAPKEMPADQANDTHAATATLIKRDATSSATTPTPSMTAPRAPSFHTINATTARLGLGKLMTRVMTSRHGDAVEIELDTKKPPPPYLLPRFVSSGQIQNMVRMSTFSHTGELVMEQAYDRLLWLLSQLQIVDDQQTMLLKQLRPSKVPASDTQQATREELLAEITNLVKHLADEKLLTSLGSAFRDRPAQLRTGELDKWTELLDKELSFVSKAILKIANALLLEVRFLEETVDSRWKSRLYGVVGKKSNLQSLLSTIAMSLVDLDLMAKEGLQGSMEDRRMSELCRRLSAGYQSVVSNHPVQSMFRQLASWLSDILTLNEMDTEPGNEEAKRVIQFFLTSLYNPDLKQPPMIHAMKALTTLTPHYEEEVVSALDPADVEALLGSKLSGGDKKTISSMALLDEEGNLTGAMQYVKTVNASEWANFQERVLEAAQQAGLQGVPSKASEIQEFHFKQKGPLHPLRLHLMMWASVRVQHLARTTRGMMLYAEAIKSMAKVEYVLDDPGSTASNTRGIDSITTSNVVDRVVDTKYRYIITSQVFGQCLSGKKGVKGKWVAKGVQVLMNMYPGLRVAYIDSQEHWKVELPEYTKLVNQQYSVLVRAQPKGGRGVPPQAQQEVSLEALAPPEEVYRVRLPLNYENAGMGVVLGEGKPENQNHAIIFCFGELLQTIDMNQDNNLAEAFKVRNLCSEFKMPDRVRKSSAQKRQEAKDGLPPSDTRALALLDLDARVSTQVKYDVTEDVALVGFREWIFSADSGALADFAATTEFTFGTIVQRVMTYPGAVRFHYGHPDVWNKQYAMTRGGVSKANKVLHVSEDVFGGYNIILRGGKIKYVEYISVGKGRDMGFSSINGFEAKIAQGNGEQVMSREVYRLGTGFDFCRLMAWYHTGNGFFINSALTMMSVYISAWVLLFLSLALEDGIVEQAVFKASAAYSNVQILQLGMFSIVVFLFAMWLERGPVEAILIILRQFFSGSLLFYVFRAQTTNHYFVTDVKYGGAGYIATGRGYTLSSVPFVSLFQNYARSHMAFGAEVGMLLSLVLIIGAPVPGWSLWSGWLVVIATMFGPFWFNPFVFEIKKTRDDYAQFSEWTSNRVAVNGRSWVQWNKEQLEKARNDSRKQTDRILTVIREVSMSVATMLLSATAISSLSARTFSTWPLFAITTAAFIIFFTIWFMSHDMYIASGLKVRYRMTSTVASLLFVGMMVLFGVLFVPGHNYRLKNVFIILYANYQLLKLFNAVLTFAFPRVNLCRVLSDRIHKVGDVALGLSIFTFLFAMSLINQVFNLGKLQAVLLFNSTYAQQYITEQEVQGTVVERWYKEFQADRQQAARLQLQPAPPQASGSGGETKKAA